MLLSKPCGNLHPTAPACNAPGQLVAGRFQGPWKDPVPMAVPYPPRSVLVSFGVGPRSSRRPFQRKRRSSGFYILPSPPWAERSPHLWLDTAGVQVGNIALALGERAIDSVLPPVSSQRCGTRSAPWGGEGKSCKARKSQQKCRNSRTRSRNGRLASLSFRDFSDMNVEACPGQEGSQLKGREALTREFGAPINAGFTFHGLTPRLEVL